MTHRRINYLLVLVMAVSGSGVTASELSQQRKQQLTHLLRHDCGSCHGMTLKGGLGPELTANTLAQKSDNSLVSIIMYGRPGTAMPPWKNLITEDDARWLVHFMKTGAGNDEKN